MTNYQEARNKLTNTQLNKLKPEAKNKTCTTLRLYNKNIEDEEFSSELFLTARETIKTRSAFAKNMSTNIKLIKAPLSNIVQSDESFGSWLGKLEKKTLTNIAISLARDNLHGLVSNLTSDAINKLEKNKCKRSR